MRFTIPLLVALVASVSAVSLTHKPHAVAMMQDPPPAGTVAPAAAPPAGTVAPAAAGPAGPAAGPAPAAEVPVGATATPPPEDEFNMTPYVRQMANGMWEGGVPNYEDPSQAMWTRQFAAEGEAKMWAYSKTGATQEIKYPGGDGADGDEDVIDQIVKEGRSANNSNDVKNEHNENAAGGTAGGLEKPIIDATGGEHLKFHTYHTSFEHSVKAQGNEDAITENNERTAARERHAERHSGGENTSISKEVRRAQQLAKKAAKNSIWTKSVSGRATRNGVNGRLTAKQQADTQGAADSADARATKLSKLGDNNQKLSSASLNAQRAPDRA